MQKCYYLSHLFIEMTSFYLDQQMDFFKEYKDCCLSYFELHECALVVLVV